MNKKLLLAFCLVLAFLSCKEQKSEEKEKVQRQLVKYLKLDASNKSKTLDFPGKVKAGQEANLSFRISGPIEKIYVKEGQRVRKGQILAKMEDRDYKLQLSATQAEYNRIKSEVDRVVKLYQEKSVTANEYDKASYGLKQITAKLHAHQNTLRDVYLKAPFEGFISGKSLFSSGEIVGAGMPILRLSGEKEMIVEVNIPASQYLNRDNFSSYSATFSLFPEQEFPLELLSVEHTANINQLYKMTFSIDKGTTQLTAGMTTMVHIYPKAESLESFVIPNNAIFQISGKSFVWLIKKNYDGLYVQAQEITIKEFGRDGSVVCTGLEKGVSIVSAGIHKLKDGEKIRLLESQSSTNVGDLL